MPSTVALYTAACKVCAQSKSSHKLRHGLLHPLPVPEGRWTHITTDFAGPFNTDESGSDSVWIIVDRFSKSSHFFPIKKKDSPETLARLFIARYIPLHGLPLVILSDRDLRFLALIWQAVMRMLGIEIALTTARHQQANGQSESVVGSLSRMLRAYASRFKHKWVPFLGIAEYCYNAFPHSTTKLPPFVVDKLYVPPFLLPPTPSDDSARLATVDQLRANMEQVTTLVNQRLAMAQDKMRKAYNTRRTDVHFAVGDDVWLDVSELPQRDSKLDVITVQCKVLEVLANDNYKLELPTSMRRMHPVFHVSKLRAVVPVMDGQPEETRPFGRDTTDEWEVEAILDERQVGGQLEYRVHWKGYALDEATWESAANLTHCKAALREYKAERRKQQRSQQHRQ
jgi:hypothetical protein